MAVTAIHRLEIELGVVFTATEHVTFGYQEERRTFSVWYVGTEPWTVKYVVLGTGWNVGYGLELVSSYVMPDGFEVYHLCRVK